MVALEMKMAHPELAAPFGSRDAGDPLASERLQKALEEFRKAIATSVINKSSPVRVKVKDRSEDRIGEHC